MLVSSEGIVLRQRKIANNRRMLTVFTKNYGKISAGTSLSEKGKGKTALALRPFTYAEYDIFKGRDSYSINTAQTKRSYYSIGEDLDRFLVASKLIEYLDKILEEGQARPKLFDMTLEFLESVSRAKSNYDTLLYAFIIKTLRVQGVMPEIKACVNCGKELNKFGRIISDTGTNSSNKKLYQFSVSSGGVICEDCANTEKTDRDSLLYSPSFDIINVFRYFMEKPIEHFEKVALKPEVSKELNTILSVYLKRYLSVDVLEEELKWR